MSATVREKFINAEDTNVRISYVPSADDWRSAASGYNYLLGRGAQIIPCYEPEMGPAKNQFGIQNYLSTSADYSIAFRFYPNAQPLERYWYITFSGSGEVVSANIGAASDSGYATDTGATMVLRETVSPQTSGSVQRTLTFSFSGSQDPGTIWRGIRQISCFEAPRVELDPGNKWDNGIEEESLRYRYQIYDAGGPNQQRSAGSVFDACFDARNTTRRIGIFCWAVPYLEVGSKEAYITSFAKRFSGPTATRLFPANQSPIIQPRRLYHRDHSGSIEVSLFMWVSAPSTGSITLSTELSSGPQVTFPYSASSAEIGFWVTGTMEAKSDDYLGTAGVPTSNGGEDRLDLRGSSETGVQAYVSTIYVSETPSHTAF